MLFVNGLPLAVIELKNPADENATLGWLESLGYAVLHLPTPQGLASRQAGGPLVSPRASVIQTYTNDP